MGAHFSVAIQSRESSNKNSWLKGRSPWILVLTSITTAQNQFSIFWGIALQLLWSRREDGKTNCPNSYSVKMWGKLIKQMTNSPFEISCHPKYYKKDVFLKAIWIIWVTQNKDLNIMEGKAFDPSIIMRKITTLTNDFYFLLPCDENILHQICKLTRWKPS